MNPPKSLCVHMCLCESGAIPAGAGSNAEPNPEIPGDGPETHDTCPEHGFGRKGVRQTWHGLCRDRRPERPPRGHSLSREGGRTRLVSTGPRSSPLARLALHLSVLLWWPMVPESQDEVCREVLPLPPGLGQEAPPEDSRVRCSRDRLPSSVQVALVSVVGLTTRSYKFLFGTRVSLGRGPHAGSHRASGPNLSVLRSGISCHKAPSRAMGPPQQGGVEPKTRTRPIPKLSSRAPSGHQDRGVDFSHFSEYVRGRVGPAAPVPAAGGRGAALPPNASAAIVTTDGPGPEGADPAVRWEAATQCIRTEGGMTWDKPRPASEDR